MTGLAEGVYYAAPRDWREWHKSVILHGAVAGIGRSGVDPERWGVHIGKGGIEVMAAGRYIGFWWPERWPFNRRTR